MLEYYRFKAVYDLFMKGMVEEAKAELRELQQRYVEVCQENSTLRGQVQEFEDTLFLSRNLIFDGNVYWLITGSIKQGPFCTNCYNKNGILVRITDMFPRRCASCGEIYERARPQGGQVGQGKEPHESVMPRAIEQSAAIGSMRAMANFDSQRRESSAAVAAPALNKQRAKIIPLSVKRG